MPAILADIKKQGTKYGSAIEYYEACGLIYTKEIRAFKKDNIFIELVPVDEQEHVLPFSPIALGNTEAVTKEKAQIESEFECLQFLRIVKILVKDS